MSLKPLCSVKDFHNPPPGPARGCFREISGNEIAIVQESNWYTATKLRYFLSNRNTVWSIFQQHFHFE